MRALRNTYRYLQSGGTFRLVVPDLEQLVQSYLASSVDEPGNWLMEVSGLGRTRRPRTLRDLLVEWLGNSAHLWLWDEKSLASVLRKAGFTQIRRASFGDASDLRFSDVEDPARFEGCLAMQCVK
ncbi:MAG: methyltransferase type 11 [Burkholderiales bacterium]|nr:methyltransferase type 11 [Burkholderiales bacterium]